MINMNHVQILGKVTLEPKVRSLKNGAELVELGVGINEGHRNAKGEWENKMHFVDVVLWDQQAEYAKTNLKKGDGVLVLGSLQYDSWEKDGRRQSRLRIKGQRVQQVPLPQVQPQHQSHNPTQSRPFAKAS